VLAKVADGANGPQIWTATANILNKQLTKCGHPASGLDWRLKTPRRKNPACYKT